MGRIELTERFFEDEVREGFYIPACIKQAWGAQIQVFNEVDRICGELGIKYFADMGTFLGAVRHGGFVPWDDDFDFCMLRDDYNRFLDEGVSMLPEGYAIYNIRSREDHTRFVANVVAKNRICFEPDHLERFHGFPYIASVDLFILDYISNDVHKQEIMRTKAQYVIKVSDEIREGCLEGNKRREAFEFLDENLGIRIPQSLSDNKIRQILDIKAEELFASFVDEKSKAESIVYMMPFGLQNKMAKPARDYIGQVDMPFETGTVPVPMLYDDALRRHYGDYMQLYKGGGAHNYPFFEVSRAQLQEVLDFELPEYRVDADEIIKKAKERGRRFKYLTDNTYKIVVNDCLAEMERLISVLEDTDDIIDICSQLQQLAIDLGTYMEAVKGEGYDLVALLEEFCEALYELTQAGNDKKTGSLYASLCEQFWETANKVRSRKEVLFLPFKGEYWGSFDAEYCKAIDDPDIDVYIVPIPYYYKDYMGRLHDMQFAPEKYPSYLNLTHYDDYDYALRHPDVIYIQNPYDEWNVATSLPPFFYSDKLLEYTDKLVYIPWFKTDDFTRENGPEYVNMRYYCTMPGVVNADRVILQSETIRNTYIEKLCDFAGEETRGLWERKLVVAECDDGCCDGEDVEDKESTENEISVRTLLYYPDFSCILQRGQKAIEKIKDVVRICRESGDSWRFIFYKGRFIDDLLREMDAVLYEQYMEVIDEVRDEAGFEVVSEGEEEYEMLVRRCSAYYGDGGHLAHLFRNAGKPVKLQDYENRDLDDIGDICECADF